MKMRMNDHEEWD
jgi:hypothetical protein